MPNISIPLPEVDKSITRPSVFSIVRQVMEITGIPKDTPVLYKGHSDGQAQQVRQQLCPGGAVAGGAARS